MRAIELWSFSGRTDRKTYFLVGLIAFLLKSNLDRVIATYFFLRPWGLLNYWFPFPSAGGPWSLKGTEANLGVTLLAVSLPFIWLGLAQTVRRLRDCELPLWTSVLFFAPFVNIVFFAILCCLPSSSSTAASRISDRGHSSVLRKDSKIRAALGSILATTAIGVAVAAWGTQYQHSYGWGLFVALPVCLGLFSVLIYSRSAPRGLKECVLVSMTPMALLALGLLLLAFEGVICILMAAPLGMGLSALGGVAGYTIQESRWTLKGRSSLAGLVLMAVPFCMGIDSKMEGEPSLLVVQSSIEINAPPELVWKKVVAFTEISEPREWLFHTGIAYPIRATLSGKGVGAVRRCEFSTGSFVEPIQVWDEPHLLRFGVAENPAPLEELTPYRHIEPPHLKGYFVSRQGQFELTPLGENRVRLTGTTWYTDRIWPSAYWRLWSDFIIHRIHMRVLQHIRLEAQSEAARR